MKNNYLVQAWLVLVLAICFGAALAGVQVGLGPRIERNKRAKTLRQIPSLIHGQGQVESVAIDGQNLQVTLVDGQTQTLAVESVNFGEQAAMKITQAGEQVGWVVRASGQGYADVIELLIGLSPDASTITGIAVLSQKETPALGDKITTADFRGQFAGTEADGSLAVTRDGGSIEPITAATISSRSVCDIVNEAVSRWQPKLKAD
jgi:electron transport complex protein RnfG